jgi:flagellar biosynthesis/type III secretory pathway M-ring protein FliF/YscJ
LLFRLSWIEVTKAMPSDQDALISEIQRLRNTNCRWRAVALALVFVVMLPFTVVVREMASHFQQRATQLQAARDAELKALLGKN